MVLKHHGAGSNRAVLRHWVDMRSQMDYQRWLFNEHQVNQFILSDRLVDLSYAPGSGQIFGPFQP